MDDLKLDDLINAIIGLLSTGAVFRIILLLLNTMSNPEESDGNKKKVKNTIKFVAIALGIFAIKDIIISAYT